MKLRILHLEDNGGDAELIRLSLARGGLDCDIRAVSTGEDYLAALGTPDFDVILSDSGVPGFDGGSALGAAQDRCPGVPFIIVSGSVQAGVSAPRAAAGAVGKSELERLVPVIRTALHNPGASAVADLEQRITQRTSELQRRSAELEVLHRELESFLHSVAHDLRGPLITIDGFAQVLLENHAQQLDEAGRGHLDRITAGARRMHRLINDLLELSKVVRVPAQIASVDLSHIAAEVVGKLRGSAPERSVAVNIAEDLVVDGDPLLLRIALENLLGNAWKFTSKTANARIEFGSCLDRSGRRAFFVRDNGVGFDPRHAGHLFNPFRRMHPEAQFTGSGIGLAMVRRIVHRHRGEVWAEAAVAHGACFYFTLPGPG